MSFRIQKKAILGTWYEPDKDILLEGVGPLRAGNVSTLRSTIYKIADTTSLDFRQHFRIITDHGAVVQKFVVKPGRTTPGRIR